MSTRARVLSTQLLAGLVFVLVTSLSHTLSGQVAEATVVGRVADPSGAVVVGAKVTATNSETGLTRTVTTDSTGNYHMASLQPGPYEVTAEMSGFRRTILPDITLRVGEVIRLDIQLEVGELTQQIEVTGQLPLVETERPSIGTVVEQGRIVDLPLNGRNFLELALLTGGLTEGNGSFQKGAMGGFGASAAGQPVTENSYRLDGTTNQEGFTNIASVIPSADAIQEFNMQVGQYSAEYGGGGGAVMNVVTRSGSNTFHGALFEFLRNDTLDATNFFATSTPPLKRNQFGVAAGGPIIRNKTFFFGNYEGTRIRRGVTFTSQVPTQEQRSGNLSSFGKTLTDPSTGAVFPGGVIPADRIDPISAKFLDFYPLPNNPADPIRNFTVSPSSKEDGDSFIARVDHTVSSNHTIYGRYAYNDRSTFTPGVFSEATGVGGTFNEPNFQNLTLKLTSVVQPTLVNEFRFGYLRTLRTDQRGQNLGNPIARNLGLTFLAKDDFAEGFVQSLNLQSTGISGTGEAGPIVVRPKNIQFENLVSWTRGAHTYKFGGEVQTTTSFARLGTHAMGNYTFNGQFTGDGFADFLLGTPSTMLINIGENLEQNYDRLFFSAFITDDWKVSPKLTLNLGLRYELETVPRERDGNTPVFDPSLGGGIGGLAFPRQNTIAEPFFTQVRPDLPFRFLDRDSSLLADLNNFAPRFGFAYRPFGGTRTVVRGGYGWFYSSPQLVNFTNNQFVAPPMTQWPTAVSSTTEPELGWNKLNVPDPNNLFAGVTFGILAGPEEQFLNAYTQQWSLSVGQDIGSGVVVEAQYLGSKSTQLEKSFDHNFGPPSAIPIAEKSLYPKWGRIFGFASGADGNYHALLLSAEKRLSEGLAFKTSYTFGKAIADHGARDVAANIGLVQDATNLDAERGVTTDDVRHRFVANWVYELPFGPGKPLGSGTSGVLGQIIGGWHIAGIYSARTGFPITPGAPGSACNSAFNNICRPNVLSFQDRQTDSNGVDTPRFNRSAFEIQTFAFGNAGPRILTGNGVNNWDLSILKDFFWSEDYRVQFRFEIFNAFNHPQFGNPNASVSSPSFGRTFSANDPRILQFGLKFYW